MQNREIGVLGIDASRNRSGGAKAHLVGILSEYKPEKFRFQKIHLWAYRELLDLVPNYPWLVKHCPEELSKSIFHQLYWQRFKFAKELKDNNCSIVLNTDAGTVSKFKPSVTMSRDMLSFEPGEMQRYGFTLSRIRLELLKIIQIKSLKHASGSIFLTRHAFETIQRVSGKIKNYALIPHGVGNNFKESRDISPWPSDSLSPIKCIYVSPAWRFKHQWQVVRAVELLRNKGLNITLTLVGGGSGKALKDLDEQVAISDPKNEFVTRLDFVPHDRLPNLLADSNLFIFASSCENMPNSLVEAMAIGLPIACSNRGPMPEILKDAGVYFDPEDSQSIAHALSELAQNFKLRKELSHRAKQYSKDYSWSRCSKETWDFLYKIIGEVSAS